ncbi:DUF6139 family protein [Acidovorax sp. NCPPB 3576]|uniref:DUF6139 family protein n=1 Tax=Acidovorax sp. NCPPB 3576 TaxID=2940488 RepID=UPI00234B7D05|nr:DUF6139 family protein [Acidovorax sp. NCPPB 3576]WCM88256.1 DUF6139 family protein [Acidovorax sp. NCPPB 3576]
MRVDIYRRAESDGKFSHLAVPEGRPIPQEAINVDWETEARGQEMDENADHWDDYGIAQPSAQIDEKGYAITSVRELTD